MNEISIRLPRPHAKQQEVLDSKERYRVLQCGRRFGKTVISQIIAIRLMLAGKKVAYVTPEFGLGKDFFKDVLQYLPAEVIKTDNKSELLIELVTGGSLKFFSGEALDSFRGRKFHMVIIDEAAMIPDLEEAWKRAIRPTLIDFRGEAIFISTPRGKNFFYSLFLKGKNKEDNYESFHYTTYDNPTLPAGELEEIVKDLTQAQINEEILAIAGENANNPFGTDNIAANVIPVLSTKPAVVYGIDLGKKRDKSIIIGLDGEGVMCYYSKFLGPMEITKQRIQALPAGVLKVLDASGGGDYVLEDLQKTVHNLIGFIFTSTSKPNLVLELIQAVQAGKIKYNEETANEMYVFQARYSTASNHIKYEAQSGFHDDSVMALAMAYKYWKQSIPNANIQIYFA